MGLDGVEIICAIEESFGIEITDDEAGSVRTVGDVYNLVLSKVEVKDSGPCLTSAAFYRLRRGIIEVLGLDRKSIKPALELSAIFPRTTRRQTWGRLRESTALKLPPLEHAGWLQFGFCATACILVFVLSWRAGLQGWSILLSPLILLVGLLIGALTLRLVPFLAFDFPESSRTVGDLTNALLVVNQARLRAEFGSMSTSDVWETVVRIFAAQTGLPRDRIVPDARIVDDLGID